MAICNTIMGGPLLRIRTCAARCPPEMKAITGPAPDYGLVSVHARFGLEFSPPEEGWPCLIESARSASKHAKPFRHVVPIDDAEKGVDVVRPAILVFQIVSMLPHVEAKQHILSH